MASKSMEASPNVRGLIVPPVAMPSVSSTGVFAASVIATLLIDPEASPESDRLILSPQQGNVFEASQACPAVLGMSGSASAEAWVTHSDKNSSGRVPPFVRSYWIRTSPAVRTGVRLLVAHTDSS